MEFCIEKNCADCCTDAAVPLLNADIDRIVMYGFYDVYFVEEHNGVKQLRTNDDGCCVFYKKDSGSCEIEDSKPERCKLNPYCICDKNPASYTYPDSKPVPKSQKESKMQESMVEYITTLQHEVEWRRKTGHF